MSNRPPLAVEKGDPTPGSQPDSVSQLVPVPGLKSLSELNAIGLAGCESDLERRIAGRSETVRESFARERLSRPVEKWATFAGVGSSERGNGG
jgi:hypothetical protein